MAEQQLDWTVAGSRESHDTVNPINQFMEVHFLEAISKCRKDLEFFPLGKGDPTVFGNLPPHPAVGKALQEAINSGKHNGYDHSAGMETARRAVAEYFSKYSEKTQLSYDDVFITAGAHSALEICFRVLVNPGQCILLSRPCYTIYKCFAGAIGAQVKHYNLLAEREWEVDLDHLDEQLREGGGNIAAIVINNPSNPCGSVYSKQHLLNILSVIGRYRVPVIADEVYMDMVYKGQEFHPIGSLTDNIPVLSCCSLSKKYLVPGWRVGWITAYNKHGCLTKEIKPGIARMLMKVVVPCTMIQAAIPDVLKNVPESYIRQTMEVFESNANICYSKLKGAPGLNPIRPSGAMYIMIEMAKVHFPEFPDDVSFMKQLIIEQGVMAFPGSIFQYPWSMRVTLIMPTDKLTEACNRLTLFCKDHYRQ